MTKGREVDVAMEMIPGIVSGLADFDLAIEPRNTNSEEFVRVVELRNPCGSESASELDSV